MSLRRLLRSVLVALGVLVAWLPAPAAHAGHDTVVIGDVFVSVAAGLVQWRHPDGSLNGTLDTGRGRSFTSGLALDEANRLHVAMYTTDEVVRFGPDGELLGTFGRGYDARPESLAFDAGGNLYVGQAGGTRDILKLGPDGTLLDSYDVAVEGGGSDQIELGADQCTMHYTSDGSAVLRYDVCEQQQLPPFVTDLPGSYANGLRLLADGGLLVADSETIVRLDTTGAIVRSYDAPRHGGWFALALDPDGTSFWAADSLMSEVYRFDIGSGAELTHFDTESGSLTVYGLTVAGEPTQGEGRPVFDSPPTPLCGSTLPATAGTEVGFTVQASFPAGDGQDRLRLSVEDLPPAAEMTPPLPATDDPVSSRFSWTPAETDIGRHPVRFVAEDRDTERLVICVITVDVVARGRLRVEGDARHDFPDVAGDLVIHIRVAESARPGGRPSGELAYQDERANPPGVAPGPFGCQATVVREVRRSGTLAAVVRGDLACEGFEEARRFVVTIYDLGVNPPAQDRFTMRIYNRDMDQIYLGDYRTTVGLGDIRVFER